MKPTWKLIVGPTLLAGAITALYMVSIDLSQPNRADIAFALMILLAQFNCYIAYRWFEKGFMTFERLKAQEEVASGIIKKLIKKYAPDEKPETVMETIVADELGVVISDLKNIIEKHKS